MQRYAICVEYDGTDYSGWQIQLVHNSIQSELASAISKVADENVMPIGSGRTDAGVHAKGQIAHFDSSSNRSEFQWLSGINSELPKSISVKWIKSVDTSFHAKNSAMARCYSYTIYNASTRSSLHHRYSWHVMQKINIDALKESLICLVGEHDFSSFRASGCQSKSPFREMFEVSVAENINMISIKLEANAFLYHMVRNIVGTAIEIGVGKYDPSWMRNLLELRDRKLAGPTAPPQGLCLESIKFPNAWNV